MKYSNLKDVVLAVTYRCNSRCRMCSIWQRTDHDGEITPEDLQNFPKSITDLNFSGGEPFLRTDLVELVRSAKEYLPKTQIIISTNAFATSLIIERMQEILAVNPKVGIAISLDGVGTVHDEIRGIPGGYDRVMETIKGLQKMGLKNMRLAFTMGDYNYQELPKVYALAKELGLEMTLAVVHSSDNFFGQENKINVKEKLIEQLDWLIGQEIKTFKPKRWARAYFAWGLREFVRSGERILPDYSGNLSAFVDPFGNVYPCDVSSQRIGNLKKTSSIMKIVCDPDCAKSWMICTARQAIKKHWFKAISWIIKRKFFGNK